MGVVLPGEADAAVHLDVELGAEVGGRDGQRGRRGRARPRTGGRRPRPARAASHTEAVASSVATIMLAQWCLTAWNVAMGRPNCSRTLAYSLACIGALERDAGGLGGQDRPGQVEHGLTGAGQDLGRGAVEGDAAPPAGRVEVGRAPRRWHRRPRGRRRPRRRRPPRGGCRRARRRARRRPSRRPRRPRTSTSPPSATAPAASPSARPGSSRAASSSGAAATSTALAMTVGTNGPGAMARPSSSTTTSSSGRP